MNGIAAAQATQSSRVKPRPVIAKAPRLLQLCLILVDPDAPANVRFGSIHDRGGPTASQGPEAEVSRARLRDALDDQQNFKPFG